MTLCHGCSQPLIDNLNGKLKPTTSLGCTFQLLSLVDMPFPALTRQVLEYYTAHQPPTESVWYGPWTTILTTLFPATDGFVVTPQLQIIDKDNDESTIPNFVCGCSQT